MHRCSRCGIEDKLYERGRCERCALRKRATELMTGPDGTIPAGLVGVYDAVIASATPRKALNWLRQGAGAPILAAMGSGAIEVSRSPTALMGQSVIRTVGIAVDGGSGGKGG